ncbi:MAG: flagellar hook-length control protein FliK [Robiginitomaculum sp.]|nr:flagellar hook-length control protein FliK [Robiginitomaculum sp.]MDQ7076543.1 flagellar hook-length control protein FliK [Robiginitomaculum sp.]
MSLDFNILATASGNGVKTGAASSVAGQKVSAKVSPQKNGAHSAFADLLNASVQANAQGGSAGELAGKVTGKTSGKTTVNAQWLQSTGKKPALKGHGLQSDLASVLKPAKVGDEGEEALVGATTIPANAATLVANTKDQSGKNKPSAVSGLVQNTGDAAHKTAKQGVQPNPGQIRRLIGVGGLNPSDPRAKIPAITVDPIIAELDPKGGVAPAPSPSPAIQSGSIEAALDPKPITTPQPSTSPAIKVGSVVSGLEPSLKTTPQPSRTPAIKNGPVVAGLDAKTVTTPPPSKSPVIQSGPVIAGLDTKSFAAPQPAGMPAIGAGPVIAEQNQKGGGSQPPSGTPAIKTGPVVAGLTPGKTMTPSLSGLMQGLSTPEEVQQKATRRVGHGTSKTNAAKGSLAKAGGQSGTSNTTVSAANAGNVAANAASFTNANTVLAQAASSQPYNSQSHDNPGSTLQNGAPAGFAGLPDAGLDGRVILASTSVDHGLKSAQTHDIAQKATNATSHTPPRLDQASLAGFAANMAQRMQGGGTRFEIRLDPAELGKVQVKLEVSADNRVEAVLSSHRPEVLADLQRGADALRRALSDMGFDLGADGLSFSLEQGTGGFGADQDASGASGLAGLEGTEAEENLEVQAPILAQSDRGYGMTRVFAGRVDVRL